MKTVDGMDGVDGYIKQWTENTTIDEDNKKQQLDHGQTSKGNRRPTNDVVEGQKP